MVAKQKTKHVASKGGTAAKGAKAPQAAKDAKPQPAKAQPAKDAKPQAAKAQPEKKIPKPDEVPLGILFNKSAIKATLINLAQVIGSKNQDLFKNEKNVLLLSTLMQYLENVLLFKQNDVNNMSSQKFPSSILKSILNIETCARENDEKEHQEYGNEDDDSNMPLSNAIRGSELTYALDVSMLLCYFIEGKVAWA